MPGPSQADIQVVHRTKEPLDEGTFYLWTTFFS